MMVMYERENEISRGIYVIVLANWRSRVVHVTYIEGREITAIILWF